MNTMKMSFAPSILLAVATMLFTHTASVAQAVVEGKPAPEFQTVDVLGNSVSLSALKGKKILLSFMRNAGCPVCNWRVHELSDNVALLKAKNVEVVLVYESGTANLLKYVADLDKAQFPFRFVSDSSLVLYKQYEVGKSIFKFFGSMFNGITAKMDEGKKMFKSEIEQDGSMMRIPADILIDESGKVIQAHYGAYVGDHLALQTIQ
jgi:thioredoxin-dependent peroxiredoxin